MPDSRRTRFTADGGPATQDDAPLWVEISRGRTRFPRRPVTGSRFLIGAGSNCHLQLGGEGMPFLHSLIAVEPTGVVLEAFVPYPELKVNGEAVRTSELRDGDQVAIGPFEFTLHGTPASTATGISDEPVGAVESEADIELADLHTLSASELVARIESAEDDIARNDELQQPGAAALLAAIRNAGARLPEVGAADIEEAEAELLSDLTGITQELEQRLTLLREQEHEQNARAEALLSAQDRLAEQLRLAALSLSQEQARVRASA